jgi:hypothetical protein
MGKYCQTVGEIKSHLNEHILFLERSSKAYDEGYLSEAKRMAVTLRVLLHDTSSSKSILFLLNKKNMLFYDTSIDYDPANLLPTLGLVVLELGPTGGKYVAPLDEGAPPRYKNGKVPFDVWWNKIVLVDKNKNKFTRKDIVLSVADKDGGAHVDPQLDKPYAELTRYYSIGWKYISSGEEKHFTTPPELASIRQISHEILKSLYEEFSEFLSK